MAKSVSRSSLKSESLLGILDDVQIAIDSKILKVKVFTSICKPLNGAIPGSNQAHFLKLWTFPYKYKYGKEYKESSATAYFIKGLRGALRHQVMYHCKERGLEVCHTSDKETDRKGKSLLPNGFHLIGSCTESNECIVHAVFGSKRHTSKIRVSANPIANISQKTFQSKYKLQNVHIATEKRVALSYDGGAIQDFGERYFAGEFEFEIDVSKCSLAELGLLIESAMYMQKLGRGYNAGYAQLEVQSLTLVDRIMTRKPILGDNQEFKIEEQISETPLSQEFLNSIAEWTKYVKKSQESPK
ncbi:hypothetical protein CEE45_06900 [Candidatus Heimdallarchaeota archaeon B3_Heim]|nr:MAG: hypothetical protein CEE45_06900 [Candidatus Heimdallarchaeota archaeon B3_Heim]